MIYKTRPQLLRDAAASMEMQEAAGVEPVCKFDGFEQQCERTHFESLSRDWEFPLAVIEGKQVWVGSVLHCRDFSFSVKEVLGNGKLYGVDCNRHATAEISPELCSWNPPAPKLPEAFEPWHGGEWTGHPKEKVEVILRDLTTLLRRARKFRWSHEGNRSDIIGYRLVKKYEEPKTLMV